MPEFEETALKPWYLRHRALAGSSALGLSAVVYRTAQELGWWRRDAYTFPLLVLGLALLLLFLAATSEPARRLYARYDDQEYLGRVVGAIGALVVTVAVVVVLVVGFLKVQQIHSVQLARLRGDPVPAVASQAVETLHKGDDANNGMTTPLLDPFEAMAERERQRAEREQQRDEQAIATQTLLAKTLAALTETTKQLAALQETARQSRQQTIAQSQPPQAGLDESEALKGPAMPQDLRLVPRGESEPLKPQVSMSLNLAPDASCSAWGVQTEPLKDAERGLLEQGIPRYFREAKGLAERLIAGDQSNLGNTIAAMNTSRSRVGNHIENVYGPLAQVDFANAAQSNALVEAVPAEIKATLSEATMRSLRETASALSCLMAIEANLTKRRDVKP